MMSPSLPRRFGILLTVIVLGAVIPTPALSLPGAPCPDGIVGENLPEKLSETGRWLVSSGPTDGTGLLVLANSQKSNLFNVAVSLSREKRVFFPCLAGEDKNATKTSDNLARALLNHLEAQGTSRFVLAFDGEFADLAAQITERAGSDVSGIIGSTKALDDQTRQQLANTIKSYWADTDPILFETMQTIFDIQGGRIQVTVGLKTSQSSSESGYWFAQFLLNEDTNSNRLPEEKDFAPTNTFGTDWSRRVSASRTPMMIYQAGAPKTADQIQEMRSARNLFAKKVASFLDRVSASRPRTIPTITASN